MKREFSPEPAVKDSYQILMQRPEQGKELSHLIYMKEKFTIAQGQSAL